MTPPQPERRSITRTLAVAHACSLLGLAIALLEEHADMLSVEGGVQRILDDAADVRAYFDQLRAALGLDQPLASAAGSVTITPTHLHVAGEPCRICDPEQDGERMHHDGTPVLQLPSDLDAIGGPLDVDDEPGEPEPPGL